MNSRFVVFEGMDHCGKGTQIALLKNYLENTNENHNILFTREPGGSQLCEKIREILLDSRNKDEIDPITEAYLYATSRARHVRKIRETLSEGKSVICDRYFYSSLVYQGIVRGLGYDQVLELNKMAIQNTYPDLVFYIKIDMDTYLERRNNQVSLDRLEQENINFFKKVLESYNAIMEIERTISGTKIVTIDGTKSPDIIHQEILSHIQLL